MDSHRVLYEEYMATPVIPIPFEEKKEGMPIEFGYERD